MVLLCERCKRENYRLERCNYCNRMICNLCTKSSTRIRKTTRLVICKDCWGMMPRRSAFKNGRTEVMVAKEEE